MEEIDNIKLKNLERQENKNFDKFEELFVSGCFQRYLDF